MIGIFDSGSGGLSVFREIVKLLPDASYIYYSDNAHCPYGCKSKEYITERCRVISDFLISQGCDIIVIACNTATAAAISYLREHYDIPFIGMEPAVKPAVLNTKSGIVGVLATASTLDAEKYHYTRDRFRGEVRIIEKTGEGFVELVEKCCLDGPKAEMTVRRSLEPMLEAGADHIVLGCTHYPFLLPLMQKIAEKSVTFIDPAPAAAKHLLDVMNEKGISGKDENGFSIRLMASGDDTTLRNLYNNLIIKH